MPVTVTPEISQDVLRILARNRATQQSLLENRINEWMPGLTPERRALVAARIEDFRSIFETFIANGRIETIRPRMDELCSVTSEFGISMDVFTRVLLDVESREKLFLIEQMPCQPSELAAIFRKMDEYQVALFESFARARADYWQRREKEATKLHTDFFTNIPFPAMMGDANLVIRAMNPGAIECMQLDARKVIGRPLPEWLGVIGVPAPRVGQIMAKLAERGKLIQEEIEIACPMRGTPMYLLLSVNFHEDLSGARSGFQAMIQDITRRRTLEHEVAFQVAQLRAVFYSTPVGLIFVDPNRNIRRINGEACRILGYPPPEQVENADMSSFRQKAKASYKDPEGFMRLLGEVYADPESHREGMLETANPRRLVSYSVTPVHEAGQKPIGWLWIFIDVTAREAAENLKNDLIQMIVHDLKNPLTAIKGGTHVLKKLSSDDGNARTAETIDLIQRNSDKMMGMIMNLLDVERLEEGKLQLHIGEVSIARLLNSAHQTQKLAAGHRSFTVAVADEIAEAAIPMDVNLMERVLANLIGNAIKHTRPDGTITLRAVKGESGSVRIDVMDNGEGIPKEFHAKIFEKFGQAETRALG
ncbi:PAS domain-containing protein, partial [Candidatus Sumerlaeota bacterium]|nr:PAS domain-containing protein [Candidatus Sumerlaeota bacterium]